MCIVLFTATVLCGYRYIIYIYRRSPPFVSIDKVYIPASIVVSDAINDYYIKPLVFLLSTNIQKYIQVYIIIIIFSKKASTTMIISLGYINIIC